MAIIAAIYIAVDVGALAGKGRSKTIVHQWMAPHPCQFPRAARRAARPPAKALPVPEAPKHQEVCIAVSSLLRIVDMERSSCVWT